MEGALLDRLFPNSAVRQDQPFESSLREPEGARNHRSNIQPVARRGSVLSFAEAKSPSLSLMRYV